MVTQSAAQVDECSAALEARHDTDALESIEIATVHSTSIDEAAMCSSFYVRWADDGALPGFAHSFDAYTNYHAERLVLRQEVYYLVEAIRYYVLNFRALTMDEPDLEEWLREMIKELLLDFVALHAAADAMPAGWGGMDVHWTLEEAGMAQGRRQLDVPMYETLVAAPVQLTARHLVASCLATMIPPPPL